MALPRTQKQITAFIAGLRKPPYLNASAHRGDRKEFPRERDLMHQLCIELQMPTTPITTNEDGEVSSRALTDWYVKQYEAANHLTRGASCTP